MLKVSTVLPIYVFELLFWEKCAPGKTKQFLFLVFLFISQYVCLKVPVGSRTSHPRGKFVQRIYKCFLYSMLNSLQVPYVPY